MAGNFPYNVYNNVIYHAKEPEDVIDAYLTKGYVLDAQMQLPDKAAQHFQKTLAFDPGQPEALLRLAELALRKQDWPEGVSLADRAINLDFENPTLRAHLLLVKAVALKGAGDDASAARDFTSATETDVTLLAALAGAGIGQPDKVHEAVKARLQAGRS